MSYKSDVPNFINDLEYYTQKALTDIAVIIKDAAKRLSAKDTGRYQQSWDYDILAYSALIGNSVDYAEFLEFGTKRMRAQPALTPAFENNLNRIQKIVEDYYAKLDK